MAGKSPVRASEEQTAALRMLAGSRERGEADRARAVLPTLAGWTGARIAAAFGVCEDTVRLWRSDFARGGVGVLEASVGAGPTPLKAEAALRVTTPLFQEPVADRPNWTLARLAGEIARREGVAFLIPLPARGFPRHVHTAAPSGRKKTALDGPSRAQSDEVDTGSS